MPQLNILRAHHRRKNFFCASISNVVSKVPDSGRNMSDKHGNTFELAFAERHGEWETKLVAMHNAHRVDGWISRQEGSCFRESNKSRIRMLDVFP